MEESKLYYVIITPGIKSSFDTIRVKIIEKKGSLHWNGIYRFDIDETSYYKQLLQLKYLGGLNIEITNPVVLNIIDSKHYDANEELFDIIVNEDVNNEIKKIIERTSNDLSNNTT